MLLAKLTMSLRIKNWGWKLIYLGVATAPTYFFLSLQFHWFFPQPVEAHKVRHDHEIGCAQEMLVHNPPDIDFMIGLYFIVEYQNYVLP